jgi:general secretion pathway protein I
MNSLSLRARREGGFSLLEVLVAFTILALAVGTILSLFATGLRNTAVASDYARALILAESRIAYYQGLDPQQLVSGEGNGTEAGFHWHSRVSPYDEVPTASGRPLRLYRIEVAVKWGGEARQRSLQLSTLRIGQTP